MTVGRHILSALTLVCCTAGTAAAQTTVARAEEGTRGGLANVRLLMPSAGELLAFHTQGLKVFVTRSIDSGKSWTDLAGKPGTSLLADAARGGFDVCMDADGVAYLALAARTGLKVQTLKRTNAGWKASEAKMLDKGPGLKGPTICRAPSGDVWVAYAFGGPDAMTGIRVGRTPAGERFGENTGRDNVAYGFSSTVQQLVIRRGRPMLFYSGGSNHESRQIYWTLFDGKHWPRGAVGVGECLRAPGLFSVVVDDRDVVHVAWRKFGGGDNGLYYKRYDAADKWSETRITVLGLGRRGRGSGPVLATDGVRTWCLWSYPGKGELGCRVLKDGTWSAKSTVVSMKSLGWRLAVPNRIAPGAGAIPLVYPRDPGTPKAPATEVLVGTVDLGTGR